MTNIIGLLQGTWKPCSSSNPNGTDFETGNSGESPPYFVDNTKKFFKKNPKENMK